MTPRERDVLALGAKAKSDFAQLNVDYNASLSEKVISPALRIDIKNLCENLRSILDYVGHDVREKCCPNAKAGQRFYFPILPSPIDFAKQTASWYPGLQSSRGDVWDCLESVQPYQANYAWLAKFSKLNNENKHDKLVEQTRVERREVKVSSNTGAVVSWNLAAVTFGQGVFIAGVPVDPSTQLPVPDRTQKVEHTIWVDFRFEGIDESALALLDASVSGITSIAKSLYNIL